MPMPEPVLQNKRTKSNIRRHHYRTEVLDAGLPMPAASVLMPLSCYDFCLFVLMNKLSLNSTKGNPRTTVIGRKLQNRVGLLICPSTSSLVAVAPSELFKYSRG